MGFCWQMINNAVENSKNQGEWVERVSKEREGGERES